MHGDSDILRAFGQQLVDQLKANTPHRTGRTASQIEMVVTDFALQIFGPAYIGVFETGRGPSTGRSSGSPTLQEQILDWIEAAGIQPRPNKNGKTPTDIQLSWAIANSIHTKGDKLYQSLGGGKTDYFDSVFNEQALLDFITMFADDRQEKLISDIEVNFYKQ